MNATALPWALALLSLGACEGTGGENMTAGEASDIANAQMAEELPQVSLNMLRIETQNLNTVWRVGYHAPEGSAGGPIIIDINKESGKADWVHVGQ